MRSSTYGSRSGWGPRPAPSAPGRLSSALASRLILATMAILACEDCPPELAEALRKARMAISPWYDR